MGTSRSGKPSGSLPNGSGASFEGMRLVYILRGVGMCVNCAGTKIFETRGDGTRWEYVIDEHGVMVGHMVGTEREGRTYNAQTGTWTSPSE